MRTFDTWWATLKQPAKNMSQKEAARAAWLAALKRAEEISRNLPMTEDWGYWNDTFIEGTARAADAIAKEAEREQ